MWDIGPPAWRFWFALFGVACAAIGSFVFLLSLFTHIHLVLT